MGVRIIGDTKYQPITARAGSKDGSAADEPDSNHLDSGVPATDELPIDGTVTGDAGGDGGSNHSPIDPTSATNNDSGDAPFGYTASGRRRNRPTGSGRRTGGQQRSTASDQKKVSDFVGDCCFAGFEILSKLSKVPEFELDEEESEKLAKAAMSVAEEYDQVVVLDPKTIAWMNLAKVIGQLAIPRIAAAKIRKSRERATKHHTGGATVVDMPFVQRG